jgi:hypothetical protein
MQIAVLVVARAIGYMMLKGNAILGVVKASDNVESGVMALAGPVATQASIKVTKERLCLVQLVM